MCALYICSPIRHEDAVRTRNRNTDAEFKPTHWPSFSGWSSPEATAPRTLSMWEANTAWAVKRCCLMCKCIRKQLNNAHSANVWETMRDHGPRQLYFWTMYKCTEGTVLLHSTNVSENSQTMPNVQMYEESWSSPGGTAPRPFTRCMCQPCRLSFTTYLIKLHLPRMPWNVNIIWSGNTSWYSTKVW